MKHSKPSPDFPLFAHANGQWAKKIAGKMEYFGPWADPQGALEKYRTRTGGAEQKRIASKAATGKPSKPHPEYPLYPHRSRKWAKKIRGKTYYFGSWDDPDGALEEYLTVKDELLAGRTPQVDGLTVRELADKFLIAKRELVDKDQPELSKRSWFDYHVIAKRIVEFFGDTLVMDLTPEDFRRFRTDLGKGRNNVTLSGLIGRARVLFNHAFDHGLTDRPVRYGKAFMKPSRKTLRRERSQKPPRKFEADELLKTIEAAKMPMRAMIWLGINAGLGNGECAMLTKQVVDLDAGWLDYPRSKTGVGRTCPLWPETVQALRAAIDSRPTPKNPKHEDRVFITKYGRSWEATEKDRPVSKEMTKVLKTAGVARPGLNFYALRHTLQTIGQQTLDKDAVRWIMGHAEDAGDMGAVYNEEGPSEERLRRVTEHVREWLRSNATESSEVFVDSQAV